MEPTTLMFAINGAIRLGRAGQAAYEQYVRDRATLFPDATLRRRTDRSFVVGAYTGAYQDLVKAGGALDAYWSTSPVGPRDDEALAILFDELMRREAVKAGAQAGLSQERAEMYAGAFMIEQWAEGKGPTGPIVNIAVTIADIGLAFVGSHPSVMGIGGNGEKLIGALALNLSNVVPDELTEYGPEAEFADRLIGAFLRAGLQTMSENSEMLVRKEHLQSLVVESLRPVVKALPADITEQAEWREVTQALTGPAASAAIGVIAQNPSSFLGSRYQPDRAAGALVQAMLVDAAQRPLPDTLTEVGFISMLKAALGVAAERPELIVGAPGNDVDQFKLDAFKKIVSVLEQAKPPFNGDLGAEVAATVMDTLKVHAPVLLGVDDDWDEVTAAVTGLVIDGLKVGILESDPGRLDNIFSRSQLVELARVLLEQVATTPRMVVSGKNKELKNLVAAVSRAMAADKKLLLTADDWIEIARVAADEAAANPGPLFGLDETGPGDVLASNLISAVLRFANEAMGDERQHGNVAFGPTLRWAVIVTLRAAAGNIEAVARQEIQDAIGELGEWLCRYVKDHKGTFGSKEWLRLFRVLLPRLLEEDGFQIPTDIDIQHILEGGPFG